MPTPNLTTKEGQLAALEQGKQTLLGLQSKVSQPSGTGGGKAPAGMEYAPTGALQPIATAPAGAVNPTAGVSSPQIPQLQNMVQDYLTQKSTSVPSGVPTRNMEPSAAPSPVTDLPTLMTTLRSAIAPTAAAPATPNLVQTRETLAAQPGGLNEANTALTAAQQELQQFEATLQNQKDLIKGKPIASTIINGRIAQLDADTSAAYRTKQNAVTSAVNRVNMANQTLASIMQLTQQDYTNAATRYNEDFTRNLNLFNTLNTMQQQLQTQANADRTYALQSQNAASANIKTIFDSVKDKVFDLKTLTPQMEASWAQMETAAGLPQGFMKGILSLPPQVKVDHWQTDSSSGKTYAFGTVDGKPTILDIFSTGRPTSSTGINDKTLSKVQTVANQFDSEEVVKDYNTTATQVNYIQGLEKTPTDDIARVYAFAKAMDPNSAVRSEEYDTVQEYSTALLERFGLKAKRVFENSGFLTDEARTFISSTLQKRLDTQYKTYKNIFDEYGRRIDKLTNEADGTEYLTDYSKGYSATGSSILQSPSQAQAASRLKDAYPKNQSTIDSLIKAKPDITDEEILQVLGL